MPYAVGSPFGPGAAMLDEGGAALGEPAAILGGCADDIGVAAGGAAGMGEGACDRAWDFAG